jgi:hypothetical protein
MLESESESFEPVLSIMDAAEERGGESGGRSLVAEIGVATSVVESFSWLYVSMTVSGVMVSCDFVRDTK